MNEQEENQAARIIGIALIEAATTAHTSEEWFHRKAKSLYRKIKKMQQEVEEGQ